MTINHQNYFHDIVPQLDVNNLPEDLRAGYEYIEFGSKNHATWEHLDSEEDRGIIAAYFQKLEKHLKTGQVEKKPAPAKKPAREKPSAKKNTAGKTVKKPAAGKKKTTAKTPGKPVEEITTELKYIKRFVNLHGKTKTRDQVLTFLRSLQRAIRRHEIRAKAPYAGQIVYIQKKLIYMVENMADQAKITLEEKILDEYKAYAASEKVYLSISYIKRYISLEGKTGVKEKAKHLADLMRKAAISKKITKDDPYAAECDQAYKALMKYVNGDTETVETTSQGLNGMITNFATIVAASLTADKLKETVKKKPDTPGVAPGSEPQQTPAGEKTEKQGYADFPGIIPSSKLQEMEFEPLGLTGKWRVFLGDITTDPFSMLIYGIPGSGKSTFAIKFMHYLASELDKKILFVAKEEGAGATLKDKFTRLDAFHDNIYLSEGELPKDLARFDFVVLDSVNEMAIAPSELSTQQQHWQERGVSFIYIFKATKEGKVRGSLEYEHLVDISVKVEDLRARCEKNRFGGGGEFSMLE